MLFLIYGEETFLSQFYLNKILDYYQKKERVNFYIFDFESDNNENLINDFLNSLKNIDLFSLKRIIIVKNIFLNSKEKDVDGLLLILKQYALPLKDTVIFFEKNNLNKKIIDWFKKNNQKVKEFNFLTKKDFKIVIQQISSRYKYQLSPLVVNLLLDNIYPNTWLLYQILRKLSLINKKFIDEKTFKEYIFLPSQPYIFDFLDALILKDHKKTFQILEELKKETGYHPLYIFKMIENEIKNLIIVKKMKELGIKKLKNFSLNQFVIKKLTYLSNQINLEKLKKIYNLLFYYDKKIKEGSIEPDLALDLLIFTILSPQRYVSI